MEFSADVASNLIKSIGFAFLAIFFVKRYISKMDSDVEKISKKINSSSDRLTRLSDRIAEFNESFTEKLAEFNKVRVNDKVDMIRRVDSIRNEIRETNEKFLESSKETHKEYGKIIFKVLGEQNQRINKITNYLKKKK